MYRGALTTSNQCFEYWTGKSNRCNLVAVLDLYYVTINVDVYTCMFRKLKILILLENMLEKVAIVAIMKIIYQDMKMK